MGTTFITPRQGGTGQNFASSTGIVEINSGVFSASNLTKSATFVAGDWVTADGVDTYTYAQSTHGLTYGNFYVAEVIQDDGTYDISVKSDVVVSIEQSSGDVTLEVNAGEGFDGEITLMRKV